MYFAIFRYPMRNCIRKYKCEYIVYILPVFVYYFVPKTFMCEINFLFHFYLWKSVEYQALSEYYFMIGQSQWKSVKV